MRRVRIFKRALTADEIAVLAKSVAADLGESAPLAADYRLDAIKDGTVANVADASLPAKVVGDVALVDADGGKAFRFSGNGYLEVAHDLKLALTDAYSLDAWICPQNLLEKGARIIDKVKAGVDNGYLLDTCPGNSLRLITEQGTLGFDAKLEPNKWAHVAATFDAKDGLRLYVNGAPVASAPSKSAPAPAALFAKAGAFYSALLKAHLGTSYEAQHAKLLVDYVEAIHARAQLKAENKLVRLPEVSQSAADRSYIEAASRLAEGLQNVVKSYEKSEDAHQKQVYALWRECGGS